MTYSSNRRSNRSTPARRTNRRMYIAAAGVKAQPAFLAQLWQTQRAKLLALGLIVLIGLVLGLVVELDTFYVYKLEIAGTRYLTQAEIEKASGILNYNIFFVDARAVEQTLARLPEVKSARVTTRIPNQVAVSIVERKPEIIWLRGNEVYWVDSDGIGFRARANLTELPVLRDLDQTVVKPGERLQPNAISAYWAFRAVYPDGPRTLDWSAARGLTYTDEHNWKIYLGDADEMAGKLAKLRALIPLIVGLGQSIHFIDLSKGEPYYQ